MLRPLVICPVLVSALDGDAADNDASGVAPLQNPISLLVAIRRALSRVDEADDLSLPAVDSGKAGAAPGKRSQNSNWMNELSSVNQYHLN